MKKIITRIIAVVLPLVTAVAVYCVPVNTMVALAKTIRTTIMEKVTQSTTIHVPFADFNLAASKYWATHGAEMGTFLSWEVWGSHEFTMQIRIFYETLTEVITDITVPDDDYTVNEKVTPQTPHIHDFQPYTLQSATATTDEIIEWRCACGQVSRQEVIEGSSEIRVISNEVDSFMNETTDLIQSASRDGNVVFDTEVLTCFNKRMMDVLKERPDVSLTINYTYQNMRYTVTIPAGYDVDSLLDENGYCGFRYLDLIFAGHELVEV